MGSAVGEWDMENGDSKGSINMEEKQHDQQRVQNDHGKINFSCILASTTDHHHRCPPPPHHHRHAHISSASSLVRRSESRPVWCWVLRDLFLANIQEVVLGTKLFVLFLAIPLAVVAQCYNFGRMEQEEGEVMRAPGREACDRLPQILGSIYQHDFATYSWEYSRTCWLSHICLQDQTGHILGCCFGFCSSNFIVCAVGKRLVFPDDQPHRTLQQQLARAKPSDGF